MRRVCKQSAPAPAASVFKLLLGQQQPSRVRQRALPKAVAETAQTPLEAAGAPERPLLYARPTDPRRPSAAALSLDSLGTSGRPGAGARNFYHPIFRKPKL